VSRVVSILGLLAFAAVSFAHFRGLGSIVAIRWPAFTVVAGACFMVVWIGALAMLVQALIHNRLKPAFGVVFVYVMLVMLAGMRVLDGVPGKAAESDWRDPKGLLTPETEYVLHNHGTVSRVICGEEYLLYTLYGTCYMTAGGMLMTTALCFLPVDNDNQLGSRKPRRRLIVPPDSW
jgi:hypothetical protein